MKLRKNFEAVFLIVAAVALGASYATAQPRGSERQAQHAVAKQAAVAAAMPMVAEPVMAVVHVRGRRLSAAEKAALN